MEVKKIPDVGSVYQHWGTTPADTATSVPVESQDDLKLDTAVQTVLQTGQTGKAIAQLNLQSSLTTLLGKMPETLDTDTVSNSRFIRQPGTSDAAAKAVQSVPGLRWLGKIPGNGGRESAVIIPRTRLDKPFEVITYFHGHYGNIHDTLIHKDWGMKDKLAAMVKAKRNFIIVIPQGPPKQADYTWMSKKHGYDFKKFQTESIKVAQSLNAKVKIESQTVKGHSAGGLPIMNGALEGTLNAKRIDFLDASYGAWASEAYRAYVAKTPGVDFNLVYIPGSYTAPNALSLKGKPRVRLMTSNVHHWLVPKTFINK